MVNFSVDQIRTLMDLKHNIRNISVIAHVDHGKSTLSDSLVCFAGIISAAKAGEARYMDTREDEQARGITIKSTAVSLFYTFEDIDEIEPIPADQIIVPVARERKVVVEETPAEEEAAAEEAPAEEAAAEEAPADGAAAPAAVLDQAAYDQLNADNKKNFLINLIDSPGHVDFSSEVTAALRVTDGALVVVDCIEGVAVQTETVLRQAISERIKPVLFVNKLDRCLLELHMPLDDAYQSFSRAIESANVVIETCRDPILGDVQVDPSNGTVGFGSGLQGWGFTLKAFAKMYAKKSGVKEEIWMKKIWGDNFFNPVTKKWIGQSLDTANGNQLCQRGFCQYVFGPISKLFESVMNNEKDKYMKMLDGLDVKIPVDAKEMTGKALLKRIMQTWLPLAETLLRMIVVHLPSPAKAQRYRAEKLYNGPLDDEAAVAVRRCDPNGPLMMFVSKMVPTSDRSRFYAFGRVFSGSIRTNQVVRIYGPEYAQGSRVDLFDKKKIQRTVLMMGRNVEQIPDCPCGNVCGLVGVDQFLLKSGTITDSDDAHPFHCMRFSVSAVVRVAVEVKNSADLPKLVEGLKRLQKSDPLVQSFTTKTGEHIVAGAGELHLEICLNDLQNDFMKGAPLKISDPVVSFSETLTKETDMTCISKSANKHNRLFATASPLGEDFCVAIDKGMIDIETKDFKKRARYMVEEFNWDKNDALRVWSFGCAPDGKPNVLVDMTKGASFLSEIKDHVVGAFLQYSLGGVYCDEPLRGCRFNLLDITLHADAIHRGAGQISPASKKVFAACQMKSGPRLLEPLYLCDITVPNDKVSGVYTTLQSRRGRICPDAEDGSTGGLSKVKAYLPVLESFGFTQLLRQNTGGKAFPQMIFDHWELVESMKDDLDITNPATKTYQCVMDVRTRKGLKAELPDFNEYYDKL